MCYNKCTQSLKYAESPPYGGLARRHFNAPDRLLLPLNPKGLGLSHFNEWLFNALYIRIKINEISVAFVLALCNG